MFVGRYGKQNTGKLKKGGKEKICMENKAINMEIKKGGRNERSKIGEIGGQKERKRQRK